MKRKLLLFTCIIAGLALSMSSAQAQWGGDREFGGRWVNDLIQRVHADLDRAYAVYHFTGGDRDRLNGAEKQLREFARRWNRGGDFDKGRLDDAIASIQHVVDNNNMPPEGREALVHDLGDLRRMREAYDRHELNFR